MRITRFTAENFKRLVAVDITPHDNTVVIAGNNAQGKSSVLDGIMAALAGRAGAKDLVRPIRDGEKRASVRLELDDLVVERKWTPSGSTVTVSPKEGNAKLNSPQKVLDGLIGALSFDPLAFAEASPREQVDELIGLIGREQFDEITEARKVAYAERTEVNRDLKRHEAQYGALPIDAQEPVEPVDQAALMAEIRVANDRASLKAEWERLEAEIKRLQEMQASVAQRGLALPPSRPLDVLQVELEEAGQRTEAAHRHERWVELGRQVEDDRHAAAELTARIEQLDDAKAQLISEAKLPVEGLAFDEDGVTLNGVPFVQSSAAERLKVSVGIAMALNPELRVICIRDASLLDDNSKAALVELATQHDFQIWYEVVGEGGPVGIVIEDGQVQA